LRLKTEIQKRLTHIDLLFPRFGAAAGWDYFACLRFVNGARRIVVVCGRFAFCGAALSFEDRFEEVVARLTDKEYCVKLPYG
jgi:hypothetical protein